MKKWLSVICSCLLGVLTYAFMGITAIKVAIVGSDVSTYNGYQLFTNSDLREGAKMIDSNALSIYRVFAIILLVVVGLAIVYALLKTLANLNVIKLPKAVDYVFVAIAVVAIVAALGTVISAFNHRADMLDFYSVAGYSSMIEMPIYPGLILMLIESIVLSVVGAVACIGKKKA